MEIKRCMNCMEELPENAQFCSKCGAKTGDMEQPEYTLNCNDILHGRYLVGGVLGRGGFGVTYIGMDMTLNVKVAIKEYFPMGLAAREPGESQRLLWNASQMGERERRAGYESFLKEARKMAKIDKIPSIVRVRDMFLDNETAYIVMDYVEGITLKQKLHRDGPISFSECIALLRPMMEDLAKVHRQGMIHRDISPDNIMIQPDGSVSLLDLGAAKDMTAVQGVSSQVVAKKGFSPLEQYQTGGEIGTWTDVYALCATIYYCITGKLLPDAFDRIDKEEIHFPESLKEPLSEKNKEALRKGLELRTEKRTRSIEELLRQLDAGKPREKVVKGTPKDLPKSSKVKKGVWAALAGCLLVLAAFIYILSGSEQEAPLQAIKSVNEEENSQEPESVNGEEEAQEPESVNGEEEAQEPESVNGEEEVKEPQSMEEGEEAEELPVMMEDANEGVEDTENYTVLGSELKRKEICAITFQDNFNNQPEDAWDVSEKKDGTVMAWVSPAENDMYELYIGGKGGVQAPKSCKKLFAGYVNAQEIKFNKCFHTDQATNMICMFEGCGNLRELDLGNFDTDQVTDMGIMFYGCSNLSKLNLENFDTSQVRAMGFMFYGCSNLSELDLRNFDTGQVMDMGAMFYGCSNLSELDLRNFDTSQVTAMSWMFYGCSNLNELDLSSFDMSKVTDDTDMFKDCPAKVTGL